MKSQIKNQKPKTKQKTQSWYVAGEQQTWIFTDEVCLS